MSDPAAPRFDGDVVVVTGAGRGLGRAYAEHLAAAGARVVVNDVDAASVAGAVGLLAPGLAAGAPADITTPAGAASVVEAALDAFGRVDAVIANAGTSWHRPFDEVTELDLHEMWQVHVLGTFHTVRAAWPHFVRQRYGRIVTTASGAVFGYAGRAHYAAAKGAVLGLTNTLALEGQPHGISANTVLPHGRTRLAEPGGRAPDPALAAPGVAWLCHRTCTETGEAFLAGGGRVTRVRFEPGERVILP